MPHQPDPQRRDRQRDRDYPVEPEVLGHGDAVDVGVVTVGVEVEEVHAEEALRVHRVMNQWVSRMSRIEVYEVGRVYSPKQTSQEDTPDSRSRPSSSWRYRSARSLHSVGRRC